MTGLCRLVETGQRESMGIEREGRCARRRWPSVIWENALKRTHPHSGLGFRRDMSGQFESEITTVGAKKMGRFAGLSEKHLSSRTSKIANLDNGTMVESFKYLNHRQLATNSLVSKQFCDVIGTHRHQLALLYVSICMGRRYRNTPPAIKIFNKELSPKEYNEWRAQNNYSKRIPLKGQAADNSSGYELSAYGHYKGPNQDRTRAFFACVKELNDKTWALFQHFVRLLSDPFVSIRNMEFISQADVFNLLVATIDRNNRCLLQCRRLDIDFSDNAHKALSWVKGHMLCVNFQIAISDNNANRDKELLDFFATGSVCTSKIVVKNSHVSKDVVIDFVQKFMDLKSCDESQIVRSIRAMISKPNSEALKSNYAEFAVEEAEHQYDWYTAHVFELVNVDAGKKLQLTVTRSTLLDRSDEEVYSDDELIEPSIWLDIVIL
ncbi:hypothetical protein Ddc_13422 [Ditylenchus destructor]|nr:hypothetical protein Ddc_13422 [Ditylenchus destructor]